MKKKKFKYKFKISTPYNTNEILDQYINHEITNIKAAKLTYTSNFYTIIKEKQ